MNGKSLIVYFRKPKSQQAALEIFVQLALAISIAILVLYLCIYSRAEFSSDNATNSLIAQAMFDQGTLIPRTWLVANGDLMVPSAAMLIAPMLFWLPNGFAAHAVAVTVLALALLVAVMAFLHAAQLPRVATALVVMTLALGFSRTFLVMTYVDAAYVWWPMAFFAMAALIVRHDRRLAQTTHSGRWLLVGLFLLTFLISVKNPLRVAVMVVLPALVFDRFLAAGQKLDAEHRFRGGRLFGPALTRESLMLLALLAAWIVVQVLVRTGVVVNRDAASQIQITSFDGFKAHWLLFLNGWFEYLGAHGEKFAYKGLEPFMRIFRSLIVGALTFVIVLEVRNYKINRDPVRRALIVAFFAAFLPILAIYLLFDPLARDYVTTRYFTLSYLILLALATWRIRDALVANPGFSAFFLVGICLLTLLSGVQRMIPLDEAQANYSSQAMILAETLQKEGLRHGYGSWWNAGATTIMSDSRIRVDPIVLTPSSIMPYPYMVDTRWYESPSLGGNQFIVLTGREVEHEQRDFLRAKLGSEQREILAGDARILVYDHDISSQFTCREPGASTDGKLADDAFAKVQILSAEPLLVSRIVGRIDIAVRLRNGTDMAIASTGRYPITVGIHLLDREGKMLSYDFMHQGLGCAILPQQERTIQVTLPELAPGEYRLQIDRVQEGYAWFGTKGSSTRQINLTVP